MDRNAQASLTFSIIVGTDENGRQGRIDPHMAARKTEKIVIPTDKPKAARREARAKLGVAPPSRPIPPATRKPPKHKKKDFEDLTG